MLLLVLPQLLLAQNASQNKLIDSPTRPAVKEILKDPNNLMAFTTSYPSSDTNTRVRRINQLLPEAIVALEKVFPQATFGFLGRDMDLIADSVEAFYMGEGQSGRAVRIQFSTPSLRGSTPELVARFLAQLGLNLDKNDNAPKTFVVIDYTSFAARGRNDSSYPSQARYIVECVISHMKSLGMTADQIQARINAATLDGSNEQIAQIWDPLSISTQKDFSDIFRQQVTDIERSSTLRNIFLIPGGDTMAYYSEWTDKFGPIQTRGNRLYTEPIGFNDYSIKESVFKYIVDSLNNVLSEDFRTRVMNLAKQYQVSFSPDSVKKETGKKTAQRATENVPKALKISANQLLIDAINDELMTLKELSSEREYQKFSVGGNSVRLTNNGLKTMTLLTDPNLLSAPQYFEISLEALIALYKLDMIGARDFRRILATILDLKKVTPKFAQMLLKRYKEVLPLEIMLGREAERIKYINDTGMLGQNYRQLTQSGSLPLSCRFAYATGDGQ